MAREKYDKEKYLESTRDAKKKAGKNLVKGAASAVVLLSLLTGLTFSGPAQITGQQIGDNINQTPIVMDIDDYGNATVDDDDDDATGEKGTKIGLAARFKQAVLGMPKAVRILIVVPLWAIGTAIMTLLTFFWNFLFGSPLGGLILASVVGFGVLVGLYAATAKILFPDVPIRDILNKKSLIAIGIVSILLALADAVAPLFWHQYPAAAAAVKLTTGIVLISVLTTRVQNIFNKNKLKQIISAA